jgi:hypothetical protein
MPITAEHSTRLSSVYADIGFAVIPQLVSPNLAAAWESKYRSLPSKMVHVGREFHTKWTEQKFPGWARALEELGLTDRLADLVKAITRLDAFDWPRTRVWINRYCPGEYVPSHCDRAGSTQLVLCLQGLPEPERGGELFIRDEIIPLQTGDAVLFFARGLPHGTIPIGGSKIGPSGFSRVTCVFRLFAPDDLPGPQA